MIYLRSFYLPNFDKEASYLYPSAYPFGIFPNKDFSDINFAPITIFYGGNGSGKSTLLNIINAKLQIKRESSFYKNEHFNNYINLCHLTLDNNIPDNSKIIASEDIINYILSIRDKNIKSEEIKEKLKKDHTKNKFSSIRFQSMDDYDKLTKIVEARNKTQTKYVNEKTNFLKQYSNGESALQYIDNQLLNDGLYLLDEPENCLSPKFQIELMKMITNCTRYCGCQFIIATHSPFILSLPNAIIYNLDLNSVEINKWYELENVRIYYEFFKANKDLFEE